MYNCGNHPHVRLTAQQIDGLGVTCGEPAERAIKVFKLPFDGVSLCYKMRKPFAVLAEGLFVSSSRGDRIRTCDLIDPNDAL